MTIAEKPEDMPVWTDAELQAKVRQAKLDIFNKIHVMSYESQSACDLILRIGMLYGELLKEETNGPTR